MIYVIIPDGAIKPIEAICPLLKVKQPERGLYYMNETDLTREWFEKAGNDGRHECDRNRHFPLRGNPLCS